LEYVSLRSHWIDDLSINGLDRLKVKEGPYLMLGPNRFSHRTPKFVSRFLADSQDRYLTRDRSDTRDGYGDPDGSVTCDGFPQEARICTVI
jgi:hypothetical protein